jgi:hypothetical protein
MGSVGADAPAASAMIAVLGSAYDIVTRCWTLFVNNFVEGLTQSLNSHVT